VLAALLLSGCGTLSPRQDEDEPVGRYRVAVTEERFPRVQKLAKKSRLKVTVRNVDTKEIPNLAITMRGFSARSSRPGLADRVPSTATTATPTAPLFSIDSYPRGGETAYASTWALGNLKPGGQKSFIWNLTAVKPGPYQLKYRVEAGLDRKARAVAPGGGPVRGSFRGVIDGEAPEAEVETVDGETILREEQPSGPTERENDIGPETR
jgi:hypothetical protein